MKVSIGKVLVANRGEIAVRIIRTCKRLGIRTALVSSWVDQGSVAHGLADEVLEAPTNDVYLDMNFIIQAAKRVQATAIHPGFGFLSENAEFAEKCESSGLIFIGPSGYSINAMGSKSEAKRFLSGGQFNFSTSIPLIPGYHGNDQSDPVLIKEALKIGFPVLLKASAGGGGKGMRIVWKESELASSIAAARREAKTAFGDDKLLIEKYFESVRHVEIQILADANNNCINLFERDCSIQRRHQKVIEETPSPAITPELRHKMGQVAVQIGKAINYRNAGTVEFILDPENNFYFLEVNTRLQVEHPITEAITGLDLVELQIRIAEGYTLQELGLSQDSLQRSGHAIECRLYAEDPENNFFPAPGKLNLFIPASVEGVRYDSGVKSGSEISIYYDPMIAKVIAHGKNRMEAIQRMKMALTQSIIDGPKTNRLFLIQVLEHPMFLKGAYNTHFIENHVPPQEMRLFSGKLYNKAVLHEHAIIATLFHWYKNQKHLSLQKHVSPGFSNMPPRYEFKELEIDTQTIKVEYLLERSYQTRSLNHFSFKMNIEGVPFNVVMDKAVHGKQVEEMMHYQLGCSINNLYKAHFITELQEDLSFIHSPELGGLQVRLLPRLKLNFKKDEDSEGLCRAKMTGTIVSISVEEGSTVARGDVLGILNSMKMETKILSPKSGTIQKVLISPGQVVGGGQPLFLFLDN